MYSSVVLALLLSGAYQTPVSTQTWNDIDIDWNDVFKEAKKQVVLGFVCDAMLRMYPEDKQKYKFTKEYEKKAYLTLNKIIQSNKRYNEVLVDLYTKLCNKGFRPIVMKGIGSSMNYPKPELRQSGDIDIYIEKKDYQCCLEYFKQIADNDKFSECVHHFSAHYMGIEVDLHHILGRLRNPFLNKKYQRWTDENYITNYKQTTVQVNGTNILVPTVQANAFEFFRHLYGHFLTRGVGYRHLIDFAMFLRKYHDNVDSSLLKRDLKTIYEYKPWLYFSSILVNHFNLAKEECIFYSNRYTSTSNKLYCLVCSEGSFGRDDKYKIRILYTTHITDLSLFRQFNQNFIWLPIDFNNFFWIEVRISKSIMKKFINFGKRFFRFA